MKLPLSIVDVFAETPLAGNQLAVVRDAAALSDRQMQAIAREMNFSETTFVTAFREDRASVRIFTPTAELPFAGHPTVGTAWELTRGERDITLDLGAGPVDVAYEDGIGWMTPPAVRFTGTLDAAIAARLVELDPDELAGDLPIELAEVGPRFVLIPVRSLQALKHARLSADLHRSLVDDDVGVQCVFVVAAEAYDEDAQFAARMFFESHGVREDPATGSANAAFAAYLRKHRGEIGRVVVDQGVEIDRPSRLYLDVGATLRVGGKVQPVLRGEIEV